MTTMTHRGRLRRGREIVQAPGVDPSGLTDTVWAWQVDLTGTFLHCDENSLDLVGYRAEELVGMPVGRLVDIDELVRCEDALATIGGPTGEWTGLLVEGRHRNGSSMWLEVTGRPLQDGHGNVIGYEGYSRRLVIDAQQILAHRAMRRRIEDVLNGEKLTTVFQPIVELAGGTVVGVEALTRFWSDPGIPPDRWFADAASVGLGTELELLAIRRALEAASGLPEHLHISVNASPEACLDPRLAQLIRRGQVELRRIVVELTEHTAVSDYRALEDSLRDLRTDGLRVAVDDAGAGFASMQHVLQLKPAMIKLDRQVVADLDADRSRQALGAAMVSFGGHTGAQVVAEGIETPAELRMARELGMSAAQGFYLGRPTADPVEWNRWNRPVALPPTSPDGENPARPHPTSPTAVAQPNPDTQPDSSFRTAAADGFDALPDPTVVLDLRGVITATNQAWRSVGAANGGRPELLGVGVDYVDVCRRAAETGDADAKQVLEDLTSVLTGEIAEGDHEYPCVLQGSMFWYMSRITSLGVGRGAIASHLRMSGRHTGDASEVAEN